MTESTPDRSRVLAWGYILLTLGVHSAILLAPAALPILNGSAHNAAFLLAGFALALFGAVWPGLRIVHLGVILLAMLVVLPAVWFLFTGLFPEAAHNLLRNNYDHGWWDSFRAITAQGFISLLLLMGLWMRARYAQFSLRRSGSDREEREILFDLKMQVLPEEQLTFFRYRKLNECGITLIGEQSLRMRGFLQAFQRDDMLFLYDLINVPGQPECRAELFTMALQRPEFTQAHRGRVYLVANDPPETVALLEQHGFRAIGSDDAAVLFEIRQRLAGVLADEIRDWQPFGEVQSYYYQAVPQSQSTQAEVVDA